LFCAPATHHFKALREAGVIRQRRYGLERRSRLRREDLQARFPGLLALVESWQPPGTIPKHKSKSGQTG
jgi:DNA-binding transcriptional ArsR family regulator